MTTATTTHPLGTLAAHSTAPASASASRLIGALFATLSVYMMRRRTRAQLAEATPEILNDIGVSRADAETEAGKSFWVS